MEMPYICKICKYLKKKNEFCIRLSLMFSCFRRPGSLFLPRVLK